MDKTDIAILRTLQQNGRLTNVELAEKVHLSPSPCLRRVKKLELDGVIVNYKANLNRKKVGFPMTVFMDVSLDNNKNEASAEFEESIKSMPNIISCHLVSGLADYRMEVVVKDLNEYEPVLKLIQSLPIVNSINSNFAIRQVKMGSSLPISDPLGEG